MKQKIVVSAKKAIVPLDLYLTSKGPYPRKDEAAYQLAKILQTDPHFGADYASKLMHDLAPLSLYAIQLSSVEQNQKELSRKLKIIAAARKRIINSVLAELIIEPKPVDLYIITQELQELFDIYWHTPWTEKIEHPTTLDIKIPKKTQVLGQEDIVFRILLNILKNSKKAINLRLLHKKTVGRIEIVFKPKKNTLTIVDNGIGFGALFKDMKIQTKKSEIELSHIVKNDHAVSGFGKTVVGGTGRGLGIINHLSTLIGAEVLIANPKKVTGSRASIRFIAKSDFATKKAPR